MTDGWHNAFMMPRGIKDLDEINYKMTYKKKSLKKWFEHASRKCRHRYKYHMNAQDQEEEDQLQADEEALKSPRTNRLGNVGASTK